MRKRLACPVIAVLLLILVPVLASAYVTYPLVTGRQHERVGSVYVCNNAEHLYVGLAVNEPWKLAETHLHVATTLDGIPQKNGNPIPGRFAYGRTYPGCAPRDTYEVTRDGSWTPGTQLVIALHAAIQVCCSYETETAWGGMEEFPGRNWATYLEYTIADGCNCLPGQFGSCP